MKRSSLIAVVIITLSVLAWHKAAVFPSYAANVTNALVFFDLQPDVYQTGVETEASVTARLGRPGLFDLTSGSIQKCDVSHGVVVEATCKQFTKLRFQQVSPTELQGTFKLKLTQPESTIAFRMKVSVVDTGALTSPADTLVVGQLVTPDQNATSDVTVSSPTNPALTITLQQNSVSGSGVLVAVDRAPTPMPSIGGQIVETTLDVTLQSTATEAPAVTKPALLKVPISTVTPDGTKYWMVVPVVADGVSGGLSTKFLTVDTGTAQGGVIRTDNGNNAADPNPVLRNTNRLLEGVFGSGEVTLLKFAGTGAAYGRVCSDFDNNGNPVTSCPAGSVAKRRHVWMQNLKDSNGNLVFDTQAQGFFTNVDGEYRVPIAGSPYEVKAIDGFRCASGKSNAGTLTRTLVSPDGGASPLPQDDNSLEIILNTYQAPTRFGVRNPGFEVGFSQEKCWFKRTGPTTTDDLLDNDTAVTRITGASGYLDLFGFGTTISPKTLGPDDVNDAVAAIVADTSIEQSFLVPAGADSLLYDFNFGCLASNCSSLTAPTSTTDPRLAIQVKAELILPSGYTAGVNDVTSVTTPMRQFNGQLGWRTGKLVLGGVKNTLGGQALAGSQNQVTLRFTVSNLADASVIKPAVFLDNIRFQDVVITVNIMKKSNPPNPDVTAGTSKPQVQDQVRALNEIGTQSGKLVRIRRINDGVDVNPASGSPASVCNGNNLDLVSNLDYHPNIPATTPATAAEGWLLVKTDQKNFRTPAISALMCFGPRLAQASDPSSDIQVYYVAKFEDGNCGVGTCGLSITAEDYWGDPTSGDTYPVTVNTFTQQVTSTFRPQANSPKGFIVANLINLASDTSYRMRQFETAFHELGHGGMSAVLVNSNEEHYASNGDVMVGPNLCQPVNTTEGASLCSSRPLFGPALVLSVLDPGRQSALFVLAAPPKPGRCLEGC